MKEFKERVELLLTGIEWSKQHNRCPWCRSTVTVGHSPKCLLEFVLEEVKRND